MTVRRLAAITFVGLCMWIAIGSVAVALAWSESDAYAPIDKPATVTAQAVRIGPPVQVAPTLPPPPRPDPWPDIPGTPSDAVWDRMAWCESTGNWSISTGNGYYGGLQFNLTSWRYVGGTGYPHHASRDEQIYRADKLWLIQGWGAWPGCSRKLGYR